jgi:tyrosinase
LVTSYPQFGTNYAAQQGTHFWPRLEATYHNNYHGFVGGNGGTMTFVTISPRDPVFYQHHCYVDKIWQDWHNVHSSSSVNQIGSINTIPGQPPIARSGAVDARSLKVWYASDGQVHLDRYTVINTENYRYTGTITVSNAANPTTGAFTVPANTNCRMVSGTAITLNPGFSAQNGSVFSATVDPISSPTSVFNTARQDFAFVGEEPQPEPFTDSQFQVFPNPSPGGRFTVALLTNADIGYQYTIYDQVGKEVYQSRDGFKDKLFAINLSDKPLGMYLLRLKTDDGKSYIKKLVSN